jgi:urease accessory protein UreE
MNAGLKTILEALELLVKDIRDHKFLTDDVERAITMAQINIVNAMADDVAMVTYIKSLMRACFHLGQLHMAMDVLAGDKLATKRVTVNRDLYRMWRESAFELAAALEEIIG